LHSPVLQVVLLLAVPDKTSGSNAAFRFHNLYVEDPLTQVWLGWLERLLNICWE
jgi:hypothetical protein